MEKSNKLWLRGVSIGVVIISWIILIYLKTSDKDVNIKVAFIITIIISIISLIAFFGENIQKKFKREDNIPDALKDEEIMKLIEERVDKMWNHLEKGNEIEETKSKNVNKNVIVACKINVLYAQKFTDSEGNEHNWNCFWIIINSNYPDRIPVIMSPDTSDYKIEKAMNYISQNPDKEPDTEETVTENQLTGTKQTTKKVKHTKKEEKKEELV